jgi:hypothetical protein
MVGDFGEFDTDASFPEQQALELRWDSTGLFGDNRSIPSNTH